MKKIYKSLTVSAIVATVSLSALPQSLAITHESQPTKQQRTVLFDRSHLLGKYNHVRRSRHKMLCLTSSLTPSI
ncbi:hypothetical protein, partial [Staphylococcus aureus]|uniref:hypothetical protein n=1 Tax=Staphylococcus aureus TaxID=1280 RepID=UPI001556935B